MPYLTDVLGPDPITLTLAGNVLALDRTAAVSIRHGRESADRQPDAATCTLTLYADAVPKLPAVGDALTVRLGPSAATYFGYTAPTPTNLALGKPVTASVTITGGALANITDGSLNAPGAFSGVANGYVQVDLGSAQTIDQIKSWHYFLDGRTYAGTKVQVSADGSTWTTLFDSAVSGAYAESAAGRTHTFAARPVRYIRDWLNGASGNHWIEVQASLTAHPGFEAARHRFVGTVTDLRAAPAASGLDGPGILTVTAAGMKAQLGRVVVGDVPWPAEVDGARAGRILAAANVATGNEFTLGGIDPGASTVLARDVDAQPALGLLDELADHVGAVFFARRDGALEWHDAEHRRNVTASAISLEAANVLASAVWEQQLAGLVNDLTLGYGPKVGDAQPTVRSTDAVSVATYGSAASQLSTALADSAAATARVADIVGRRSRPRWRIDSLGLDLLRTVPPETAGLLAQAELGSLVLITGFPESGPFSVGRLYVEGWSETFSGNAGWSMQLAVSEFALTGAAPRWADPPNAVTWATPPNDVTWLSAAGWYPGEPVGGRWIDEPSDRSWAEVEPVTMTWDEKGAL